MPISSDDKKFIRCSYCNQKFRFEYDAIKHEKDMHADMISSR